MNAVNDTQRTRPELSANLVLENLIYRIFTQTRIIHTGTLYSNLNVFLYNPPSEMISDLPSATMVSLKRKMIHTTARSQGMRRIFVRSGVWR